MAEKDVDFAKSGKGSYRSLFLSGLIVSLVGEGLSGGFVDIRVIMDPCFRPSS